MSGVVQGYVSIHPLSFQSLAMTVHRSVETALKVEGTSNHGNT